MNSYITEMGLRAGDKVRRIKGEHNDMIAGDTDIVAAPRIAGQDSIDLEKFCIGHAHYNLELVKDASPIRETVKRELVVGFTSGTSFAFYKHPSPNRVTIRMAGNYICPTAGGLRDAARHFIEIADYLDENAKDGA